MSRLVERVLCGLLCAGLAVVAASDLHAQSAVDYRTRLAVLERAWRQVHAERAHMDSMQLRTLPSDTMLSGPLVLLTTPEDTGFARRTIDVAGAALDKAFGAPAARLKTRPFVLTRHGGEHVDSIAEIAEIDPRGRRVGQSSVFATEEVVTEEWRYRGARSLTADLGHDFARWIRIGLPIDSATAGTWVNVRIDLVTSPAASAHECFAGDLVECALALGLTGDDDPAMRWYKPDERKDLVTSHYYYQLQRGREGQFARCARLSQGSACDSLARLIPPDGLAPRLGFDARQSVTRVALAIGGAGAFERMLAAPRRVEDQLRAASGVSTDSLMRAWHAQVVAVSPGTTTMNLATAATAIFWVGLCGALALRSSRWR